MGAGADLTQDEAIALLWSGKSMYLKKEDGSPRLDENKKLVVNPNWAKGVFVYATLRDDQKMGYEPEKQRVAKAGTRVLVTMVSRFGDVGIRDERLVPASDGYLARVQPEALMNWGREP
jgi:hypothetical protein